jgi:cytoskeletal protein CcmA (bactofilin family)
MASAVLQFKRGPAANVGLVTFKAGEPGFTTDSYDFYIGTGSTITLGINTITSELITAPDNKFFGSSRYWSKETGSTASGINLVEASDNGDNYITLAAPNSLAANVQYTFPESPVDDAFLKSDGNGILSWSNEFVALEVENLTVGFLTATNPAYFSDTTDSTDKDTGAVIVEGGVGIEKSVNIGGNLQVSGISTFVGEVTFQGGTINIGDNPNDDIIVGGEFASNVGPSTSNSYDLGSTDKQWRNLYVQDLLVGAGATITTDLDLNGSLDVAGQTTTNDLKVIGVSTFQDGVIIDNPALGNKFALDVGGETRLQTNLLVSGISTFNGNINASQDLTVNGDLYVLGTTVEVNAESMKVEDSLIEVGLINSGGLLDVPVADLNIDVGLLMHWYDGSAKKAAAFWDDSAQRIVLAKDVTESSSVLTINTYAALEIESIWINDCAGQSQLVSCTGTERFLENITVDAGTF